MRITSRMPVRSTVAAVLCGALVTAGAVAAGMSVAVAQADGPPPIPGVTGMPGAHGGVRDLFGAVGVDGP